MLPKKLQILVEHDDLNYCVNSDSTKFLSDLHSYPKLVFICDSNTRIYADELSSKFHNFIIEEIPVGEASKKLLAARENM